MYICVFDSTKAMGDRDTLFSTKLNYPCVGDKRFDMVSDMFPGKCVGLERRSNMMSGKLQLIEQPGASLGLHLKVEKMSDVVWDEVMHYLDPEMDIGSYAITRASNLVFLGSMALGSRRQRGSGQGSGQGFGQGSG